VPSPSPGPAAQARQLVYRLRTEGGTPARDAAAIGLGVFVGCSPWYGFHLVLCWALGRLLGLNRLKMYLAANISNPAIAPFLILAELQTGAWLRRGSLHPLTLETVRTTDPWTFGADVLIGSVVVGGALGIAAGLATWLSVRTSSGDGYFLALVQRAADRYVSTSITAWEFARGKLRGDPLYRMVVMDGVLPAGGVLVDVGCGQGLMLSLLAEVAADAQAGSWQGASPPPVFERLIGVETRPRVAALAQRALGGSATIVKADARTQTQERCAAVLFFDVLHMMPFADQERLLVNLARALEPGGVMLVREANAAAGWRFRAVRAGNRLKALLFGNWKQTFHFRTAAGWVRCFEDLGFRVQQRRETGEGTPFANVLFVLTAPARDSA
jgi:uncharacterized protein (DUF2062 family)/2-polyprenyl-3-methyl-5-hydroxy-6-metoxy-1,4-benzoquinol methylase